MDVNAAACLFEVEPCQRRVVGPRAGDQHVVDRGSELVEEPPEPFEVGGVEGGDTRLELEAGAAQALRVARREDHLGPLVVSKPGGLEADARAAANNHDGLPAELRLATHAVTSQAAFTAFPVRLGSFQFGRTKWQV